ncbi:MAG: helix-turn-helix domain-containing protein [Propionivibrio sp.]|nr:helix-turn-helix domain-containing protein [Propionivibrio sp.]
MCKEILRKAVDLANGQTELARGIRAHMPGSRTSQVTVWYWLNEAKIEVPPADVVIPICAFLDWQITPHELRADIYPNPLDGMPTEQAQAA